MMKLSGFVDVKANRHKRLIMSVEGLEGSGKTHFAMTAPPMVAYFDIDIGSEGVIEKFADRIIGVWPPDELKYREAIEQEQWRKVWESYKVAYKTALKSKEVKTLVVDTATELWELCRLANFGRVIQVMPNQYGPVNKEFRDLVRDAYNTDKNLVMIHKQKDEYIGTINRATGKEISVRTGKVKRAGFADMGYLCQVTIEVKRMNREFKLEILKCRQEESLMGTELETPMNTFPFLATQVYPDTQEDDWL